MKDDIININIDNDNDYDWSNKQSSNFGGGIELLMNDKPAGNKNHQTNIDIDDLNNLEDELNNLTNNVSTSYASPQTNTFSSDLFDVPSVHFDEEEIPLLGKNTADISTDSKTWDGYGNFDNNYVQASSNGNNSNYGSNGNNYGSNYSNGSNSNNYGSNGNGNKKENLAEKLKCLRDLEKYEKKGIDLSKKYTMESDYLEMVAERDTIVNEARRMASIKMQRKMMSSFISGIEYLNNTFDPFDIHLDGWGDQVEENIEDFDDVFGELYEKYKDKIQMIPELKLMMQLGGSAVMVHFSNSLFKTAAPGMDDILRQNPDLMRQFQTAAVNSMSQTNPGFSNFMNMGQRPPTQPTQGQQGLQPPLNRGGNHIRPETSSSSSSRPDISMSRGMQQTKRPDMKGPSDIGNLLSGLKTKTIDTKTSSQNNQSQNNQNNPQPKQINTQDDDQSIVSIDDMKGMQSLGNNPKRSKRRQKSDTNTISLDI